MSRFLRHEPCDKCGSKDNLSVWDDGHKFCFGCGHFVPPTGISLPDIKRVIVQKPEDSTVVHLPSDVSYNFPEPAKKWLYSYNIFHPLIYKHNIKWSQKENAIVLPVFKDDPYPHTLVMYQLRNFNPTRPKYTTRGRLNGHLPIFGCRPNSPIDKNTVVVVEDYLSAVLVSHYLPAMPLFGSNLNSDVAVALSRKFNNLIIWLDSDKYQAGMEFFERIKVLFRHVHVHRSSLDPKCYKMSELYTMTLKMVKDREELFRQSLQSA